MRLIFAIAVLAAALCCADSTETAALPPFEVFAKLDPAEVAVGGRSQLVLSYEYDSDVVVDAPAFPEKIAGLPANALEPEKTVQPKERTREVRRFELQPFEAGSYIVPEFEFTYRNDGEEHHATTPHLYLEVRSTLTEDAPDIRDITPTLELARSWLPYAIGAGALAIAIGGALVAFHRRKSKQAKRNPPPVAPETSARHALLELASMGFEERAAVRHFAFRLSEILRRLTEDLYGINATDLTTRELETRLQESWLPGELVADLIQLLRRADTIKFAGQHPPQDELKRMLERSQRLVGRVPRAPSEIEEIAS